MPRGRPSVQKAPESVAIVGLGPSLVHYVSDCRAQGGRKAVADETWGINALGDVFACDKVFHMDDVRIQEIRAAARPESRASRPVISARGAYSALLSP